MGIEQAMLQWNLSKTVLRIYKIYSNITHIENNPQNKKQKVSMLSNLLTLHLVRSFTISLTKSNLFLWDFLFCSQSLMSIISAIWLSTCITQFSIEPNLSLTSGHSKTSKRWTYNGPNQKCGNGRWNCLGRLLNRNKCKTEVGPLHFQRVTWER